jgi:hypothetical protein
MALTWLPTPEQWALITGAGSLVNVACTVVVAVAAKGGFRALKISQASLIVARDNLALTRDSLADEKRRRSVVTAIEQNDRFNRECIPEFHLVWNAFMLEHESSLLSAGNSFGVSTTIADRAKMLGASLESWALFVIYEVADETLLREVSGRVFCHQVERLAMLANVPTSEARVDWRSAYNLADKWGPLIPNKLEAVAQEWNAAISKRLD